MIAPRQRGRYAGYMGAVMAVATVSGPLLGGVIVDSSLGLALDVLRLHPAGRHRPVHPPGDAAHHHAEAHAEDRLPRRRPHRGHRLAAPAVGHLRGQRLPVVVGADRLVPRRHARRPRPSPSSSSCGRPSRSSRSACSRTSPPAWSSSPAPPSVSRCSAARPSSPSTSRSRATTARPTPACSPSRSWVRCSSPRRSAASSSAAPAGGRASSSAVRVFLVAGLAWLGQIDHLTPMWQIGVAMALMGFGMGAMMQNLVLAVQNSVDVRDIGAASATHRVLPHPRWRHRRLGPRRGPGQQRPRQHRRPGWPQLGPKAAAAAQSGGGTGTLDIKDMPAPDRRRSCAPPTATRPATSS